MSTSSSISELSSSISGLRYELSCIEEMSTKKTTDELETYREVVLARMYAKIDAYESSLLSIPVSRCPFTGQTLSMPIDVHSFAGPWWNYDDPIRPFCESPSTFCGFTGGADLQSLNIPVDHFCKPGPSHPFVISSVLRLPGVKAVLSSVTVGETVVYILSHFALRRPPEMPCVNDLGARYFSLIVNDRVLKREGVMLEELELDFDLAPWMRIGKLLWIGAQDPSWTLRSDVGLCPYVNLPGEISMVRISRGVVSRTPIRQT